LVFYVLQQQLVKVLYVRFESCRREPGKKSAPISSQLNSTQVVSCSGTPRHLARRRSPGIEPATFLSPDNHSYLLSYYRRLSMAVIPKIIALKTYLHLYTNHAKNKEQSQTQPNVCIKAHGQRCCVQILGSVGSPLRRAVLQYAVRRKQAELSSGVVRNNSLWDRLLFNRIQVGSGVCGGGYSLVQACRFRCR